MQRPFGIARETVREPCSERSDACDHRELPGLVPQNPHVPSGDDPGTLLTRITPDDGDSNSALAAISSVAPGCGHGTTPRVKPLRILPSLSVFMTVIDHSAALTGLMMHLNPK
jgi:hypothetical protein